MEEANTNNPKKARKLYEQDNRIKNNNINGQNENEQYQKQKLQQYYKNAIIKKHNLLCGKCNNAEATWLSSFSGKNICNTCYLLLTAKQKKNGTWRRRLFRKVDTKSLFKKLGCVLIRRTVMNISHKTARKLRVAYQRGTHITICDIDEKNEATKFCKDCDQFFCKKCNRRRHEEPGKTFHSQMRAKRSGSTGRFCAKEIDLQQKKKLYMSEKNSIVKNRSKMLEVEKKVMASGGSPKCSVYEIISRLHPARYLHVPNEKVYALVADEHILPSEAIGVYAGVLHEANRFNRYDWRGQVYAYDLLAKDIDGYNGPDLVVESSRFGNECRFINDVHNRYGDSRTANAEAFAVWDNKRQLPVIVIFACQHIYKYDEVIVNYGKNFWQKLTPKLAKEHAAYLHEKLQLRDIMVSTLNYHHVDIPKVKPINTIMFKTFSKIDDKPNLYEKLKLTKKKLFEKGNQIKDNVSYDPTFLEGPNPRPVIYLALKENQENFLIAGIKRLGWIHTKDVKETTHLVIDKIQKSALFLAALATCQYVLHIDWLKLSIEKMYNQGEQKFYFEDKSLQILCFNPMKKGKNQVFHALWDVYCTPNIPKIKDFITMVGCAGGRMSKKPSSFRENLVIVTCEMDHSYHAQLRAMGFSLYTIDFIKESIICGTLLYQESKYML